jgi:A/G-specific adenine glycosylase
MPSSKRVATSTLRCAVLAWYETHGRRLPFRATSDPYAILVSEAMAQQTQAERAGEVWARFMDVFPTAVALAAATPADVLRAWQGLGYNRRALNLWRAARRIVDVHGGRVPADLDALEALPGVGPYTARAVAAIAFGRPVGAVDTNVRRVLGRIVGGQAGIRRPVELQALADAVVPSDRPGAWTHALMDLGATVCRPREPNCEGCPVRMWCRYATETRTRRRAGGATLPAGRGTGSSRANRGNETPFPATSRWLRGRIVDHLRAAEPGAWLVVAAPIGSHGELAVAAALDALAHEGLVELAASEDGRYGRRLARLSLG